MHQLCKSKCLVWLQQNNVKPPAIVPEAVVVNQAKPTAAGESQRKPSVGSTTKKKVKVTRVVTRKVIPVTDGLDPKLKSIMESRRNQIKNYTKSDKAPNGDIPDDTPIVKTKLPTNGAVESDNVTSSINGVKLVNKREMQSSNRKSANEEQKKETPVANINDLHLSDVTSQSASLSELVKKSVVDDGAASSDTDTVTSSEAALGRYLFYC